MICAYYDDLQEQEYLQCAEREEMLGFTDISRLIDRETTRDDFLVLFSQPSAEESNRLQSKPFFRVLAHVGIRFPALYFDGVESFLQKILDARRDLLTRRREEYLAICEPRTPDEAEYLARISGMDVPGVPAVAASGSAPGAVRGASAVFDTPRSLLPGSLTVFWGTDDDFRFYVRKLRSVQTLFIDGDLLSPSFDSIFSIRRVFSSARTQLTGCSNTALNVLLDALSKGVFHPDLFDRLTHRVGANHRALLGNYNLFNYEHYAVEDILRVIDGARRKYDAVVLRVQRFPYDHLSLAAMRAADRIAVFLPPSRSAIRYWHQLYRVYTERQEIPRDKIAVICRGIGADRPLLAHLFGSSYHGIWKRRRLWRARWV